jgi:hypothetical protein
MSEYFTRTVKVAKYDWTIQICEPSIKELYELQASFNASKWDDLANKIFPLIKSWSCKNRDGSDLPLTSESILNLPVTVLVNLYVQLGKVLTADDDPKNA